MPIDHQIVRLARLIERARRAVVFTGAASAPSRGSLICSPAVSDAHKPIDFSDFSARGSARELGGAAHHA
jgi:hypothetical protein